MHTHYRIHYLLLLVLVSEPETFFQRYIFAEAVEPIPLQSCRTTNEKEGICINLETDIIRCPKLRQTLLDRNFTDIQSAICDEPNLLRLNETQVCCAVDEFMEPYPAVNELFYDHENFKLIPSINSSECGRSLGSTTDRIIGGTNAPPASHPWIVRLGMVITGDDDVRFPCSGSILNERYILTAAHCFKQGELRVVRLAETDENLEEECILGDTVCEKVEDHEPESIIIHKKYTGSVGSFNDIALIRLKEPIHNISSPFTRPVCLPFIHEFELPDLENFALTSTTPNNLLSVQGWGKDDNDENVGTTTLKQVYVPLRSNVFCRYVYKQPNLTISDEQICVGGTKGKGSCAGDSGSPLTLVNNKYGTRTFQIGIVSYGRRQCGLENSPVVYTRVRSFLKWILDNLRT